MPGLVRNLVILAAVDGLVLQPKWQRQHRSAPSLHVDYATRAMTRVDADDFTSSRVANESLEAYGVLGILNVATNSYVIAVNGRKHVAWVWGKPIFLITDVAFIPLTSQKDALEAIKAAEEGAQHEDSTTPDQKAVADLVDDADNDTLTSLEDMWLEQRAAGSAHTRAPNRTLQPTPKHESTGNIAQDVIGRKGVYGRFAEQWFSKRGWMSGQQRNMGMSSHESLLPLKSPPQSRRSSSAAASRHQSISLAPSGEKAATPIASPDVKPFEVSKSSAQSSRAKDVSKAVDTVLPKLLQTLKLLLISKVFYFSYDYDITRRCGRQPSGGSDLSLFRRCDPQYFWNAHLAEPLIEQGLDEYILPVMQGFVGQRSFEIDQEESSSDESIEKITDASSGDPASVSKPAQKAQQRGKTSCLLTLISRRSTKRAGLRYMRRGIDEKGNVANSVETEQILSSPSWDSNQIHSFVQTRGSIPLFYSQTPYTFKPVPTLHGSQEANQRALKTHFTALATDYGVVQAVSLLDRQGPEAAIGSAYETHVSLLDSAGGPINHTLPFSWFDFHHICRGMKFENVAILLDTLKPFLASTSWTTISPEPPKNVTTQNGIIRTNCMDCLDRTNVVQSAIAQHVLSEQLRQFLDTSHPVTTHSESFNTLWADNGDALSLTYAGTAALKGDYVRTRRRNLAGVLTDLSLSLSRYYRNLFDDFFAQAALDFVLGNVSEVVFAEFRERMVTADVGVDIGKAREMAVASAERVVVQEEEDLLQGWVLGAPASPADPTGEGGVSVDATADDSALRAQPFRQVLLLLSDAAVYSVTYDWDAEKVHAFERVPLGSLVRLQRGTYITRTLTPAQRDPDRNVGLLIEFNPDGEEHLKRVNTRTVNEPQATKSGAENKRDTGRKMWAFKALAAEEFAASRGRDEEDEEGPSLEMSVVVHICEEIQKACERLSKRALTDKTPTIPGNSAKVEGQKEAPDPGQLQQDPGVKIVQKEIVSLQDAHKGTSIVEQLEYGLKKLVWG